MTKQEVITSQLILLNKEEVKEITGWGDNVVDRLFAYDKEFPAIKKGKIYQVELTAFKEYLSKRRGGKNEE